MTGLVAPAIRCAVGSLWARRGLENKDSIGDALCIRAEHFEDVTDMTQRRPKRRQSTNTYCDFRSIGAYMRLQISSLL